MKVQDIAFFIFLGILLYLKNPKALIMAGLFSFILSMPLFMIWVFFTAQRLTTYGAGFLFAGIVLLIHRQHVCSR
jgi:hypothetical protein